MQSDMHRTRTFFQLCYTTKYFYLLELIYMPTSSIIPVYYTFIPSVAVLLALVLALSVKPRGLMINLIQAFSGGILLAGISIDLLPQLDFSAYDLSLSLSMLLGLLLMLGLSKLNPSCCSTESSSSSLAPFVTGFSIEFFINGIVIVLSALAGQFVSIITAISLGICCFVCGMAVTTRFITVKMNTKKIVTNMFLMASLFPVGGLLSALFLFKLPHIWIEDVIAFGVAVLLYITVFDLIVSAFKVKSSLPKVVFFIGFMIILLIKANMGA